MDSNELYLKLKEFLETKPACIKALKPLKQGVEIGIVIADSLELTLFYADGAPHLERRKAQAPDVIFHAKPEAIEILCTHPGDDIGHLGVAIVREIFSRSIKLTVPGSFFSLLKNGYIEIIKMGGQTFFDFLKENGLKTISRFPEIIKKLKKMS